MQSVREVMQRHVVAVARHTSLGSALRLMKTSHVPIAPVLDGSRLVGVLDADSASRGKEGQEVEDVMSQPVYALEGESVESAAKKMAKARMPRLPVVNSAGAMECTGIITSTDIASQMKR